MSYSGYEIAWLFFVYSFLGWVMETVAAALKQKRFVNRGLVNAPLCVIYGIAALAITVFCSELSGFWLFAGGMILSTVIEWTAGHWVERIYHERWWDYTEVKLNLDGYICLPMAALWGILSVVVVNWGNLCLTELFGWIPEIAGQIAIWVLDGILLVDVAANLFILSGRSRRIEQWKGVDAWLTGISSNLGRKIYGLADRRIQKAYPDAREKAAESSKTNTEVFAYGCGFYKRRVKSGLRCRLCLFGWAGASLNPQ